MYPTPLTLHMLTPDLWTISVVTLKRRTSCTQASRKMQTRSKEGDEGTRSDRLDCFHLLSSGIGKLPNKRNDPISSTPMNEVILQTSASAQSSNQRHSKHPDFKLSSDETPAT
jgi:hypothetical protein